ncbi:hypothetical protein [Vagococcus silagei]|uniref:Uncharacterized protein n=1 Tax=Vagococcus silagei TaxID=2508885 RepID=A0A4S3B3P9_9ENTE|nr:hypothetical protein [Vagococcus silagei]THB61058.1 hypothetical protein ESZ54_06920 [Vagococcus silagei]
MLFIFFTFIIFIVSIKIAGIAAFLFFLLYFKSIHRLNPKTQLEWEHYFSKWTLKKMFIYLYIGFFIALFMIAIFNGFIFWDQNFAYSIALICAGIFHTVYKYHLNKQHLQQLKDKITHSGDESGLD